MAEHADGGPVQIVVERRAVLAGLAAICIATSVGPAATQTGASHDAFLDLSRRLTGRPNLDAEQGSRIFEAFSGGAPEFGTSVVRLLAWIKEHDVDALRLQQALDAQGSPLAGLPRQVMTAWYTGIVGKGEAARCVTFETSLMHQLVADRLHPPSYCYGPHGSWSETPA